MRSIYLEIVSRTAKITVSNFVPCCAQNCALTAYYCGSPDGGQLHRPMCWKSLCHNGFVIWSVIECYRLITAFAIRITLRNQQVVGSNPTGGFKL